MVVFPGLTDSLVAVGKRINHFEISEGGHQQSKGL
jgi:hypothetical protein